MSVLVFVGFLVFLYCLYFIKNPYFSLNKIKIKLSRSLLISVNVNIRMYNFDDVQCTVIPSVAYGFVTGMNLQLC